jgi:hypothetical protein
VNRKPGSNGIRVHLVEVQQFSLASVSDEGIQLSKLLALAGVCSSENGEIPDSGDGDDDDDNLPSVSKIVVESRRVQPQTPPQVIDLTYDSDSDDAEVSWHRKPSRRVGIT